VVTEDKNGDHYLSQRLNTHILFDLNIIDTELRVVNTQVKVPRCHECFWEIEARQQLREAASNVA
jgi:hypothetical protein